MVVSSVEPDRIWFSVADPPVRLLNSVCKFVVKVSIWFWMLPRRVPISVSEVT